MVERLEDVPGLQLERVENIEKLAEVPPYSVVSSELEFPVTEFDEEMGVVDTTRTARDIGRASLSEMIAVINDLADKRVTPEEARERAQKIYNEHNRGTRPVLELSKEQQEFAGIDYKSGLLLTGPFIRELTVMIASLYRQRIKLLKQGPANNVNSYAPGLVLAYIDLDNFKVINDRYGHDAGDKVISIVGRSLNQSVSRENDAVGRLGGDEFVVAFDLVTFEPDKDGRTSMIEGLHYKIDEIFSKIQEPIQINTTEKETTEVSVGVSMGVAHFFPEVMENTKQTKKPRAQDLLRYADELMYIAKKNGKNQIHYGYNTF